MNVGQTLGNALIYTAAVACKGCTIAFYSGTQPATPETALSGNTLLASWTNGTTTTTTFSSPNCVFTPALASNTATIAASGTVSFARLTAPAWAQSTAYVAGQIITAASGVTFNCAISGTSAASGSGPTTSVLLDGTVVWSAVNGVGGGAICDLTVGTTGTDIIVASTTLTAGGGNSETLSFTLKYPVS